MPVQARGRARRGVVGCGARRADAMRRSGRGDREEGRWGSSADSRGAGRAGRPAGAGGRSGPDAPGGVVDTSAGPGGAEESTKKLIGAKSGFSNAFKE